MESSEVRAMLEDVLAPLKLQNEFTNQSLSKIEDHLSKLNSKVASHEKIINQNLPHNISLCPQSSTIEELKKNMVSDKAVKSAIVVGIGSAAAIIGIIFTAYKIFTQ